MKKKEFLKNIGEMWDEYKTLVESGNQAEIIGKVILLGVEVKKENPDLDAILGMIILGYLMGDKKHEMG